MFKIPHLRCVFGCSAALDAIFKVKEENAAAQSLREAFRIGLILDLLASKWSLAADGFLTSDVSFLSLILISARVLVCRCG
jgi:hypothetical protein